MRKSFKKVCLQFTGPTPHGFTWGLVLLKDLPKTANTVRYFHAQIKIKENGQCSKIMGFKQGISVGPIPYGIM
jgi:hypothetical protein